MSITSLQKEKQKGHQIESYITTVCLQTENIDLYN